MTDIKTNVSAIPIFTTSNILKEKYVSFDIAKLLKEAGFDDETEHKIKHKDMKEEEVLKERYVDYDIAKLLKKKGFDEACRAYWDEYWDISNNKPKIVEITEVAPIKNISSPCFFGPSAPTLQMATEWLRRRYKLHVDVGYDDLEWFWNIITISEDVPLEDRPKQIKCGNAGYKSFDDACEDGLSYCLTELIP